MATNTKIKIRLQGHEKFALRDGWLTKGLSIIDKRPDAFLGSEGPDLFGIGNNMVKSLRYWMKAFKLIEENPGAGAKLSELGKIILQNDADCRQNAFGQHSRSVFLVFGSKSVYLINNKHFWVPLFPFLAIIFASFFRFMQANVSPTFISIRAFPIICV